MTQDTCDMTLMAPSLAPWTPKQGVFRQIAVLMSGGVDSSVTAHLLLQAGWDVVGVTMKIPVACDTGKRGCCGADAAFVCHQLGLAHYFVDVTDAFRRFIIDPFQQAYAQARTPNPCIDCNTFLKFQMVWDLLERELGVRYLATGHYAQVLTMGGKARLCRGRDRHKDQSYFLYGISAERLPHLKLPLGGLSKQEVRKRAAELGLSVAHKAESMELCFAGEGDYRAALAVAQAQQEGDLTDMQGQRIGRHKGIANYTLGQRKGLGFAGGRPLYVGRIDAQANTVALGTRAEVCRHRVWAGQLNILDQDRLVPGQALGAKIRSYGDPKPCTLRRLEPDALEVEFAEPQFAPCPGQRLVLYDDEDCVVAGGTILLPR